ncbi:MAG: hypothetical protein IJ184_02955 [Alphaproteobacteria bacterium]|nr:hypothetical protein [Alphaproteobacteria bacterium]
MLNINKEICPLEIAKSALNTCALVDELEVQNAPREQIDEAELAVKHISDLISQFYRMHADIMLKAANDNLLSMGGDDDNTI